MSDPLFLGPYRLRSDNAYTRPLDFYGVKLGLKRPAGVDAMQGAAGAQAHHTLTAGAATPDAIVGGHYAATLGAGNGSWFVQALYQTPLPDGDDGAAGRRVSLDLGYRYEYGASLGLTLQVNTLYRGRVAGVQSDLDDSAGQFVYLSPGLSYALAPTVRMYGFVQQPVYQYWSGVQRTPRYSGGIGLTLRY